MVKARRQQKRHLPAVQGIRKGQVYVVLGSAVPLGILDIAAHDPAVLVFSGIVLAGVTFCSNDIAEGIENQMREMAAPDPRKVVAGTARIVDAIRNPEIKLPYRDQSVKARAIRMLALDKLGFVESQGVRARLGDEIAYVGQDEEDWDIVEDDDWDRVDDDAEDGDWDTVEEDGDSISYQIELGRIIETGDRLDPHINRILGKGMLLAGSQGTGKSNIVGLLAQCATGCQMPYLIIDFKGEFYPLCDLAPTGLRAICPIDGEDPSEQTFFLDTGTARDLARKMMEEFRQVVLDVPSYNGDSDYVAQVIAALLHALMDYARDVRKQGLEPWPALIITDEAHNFLPERQNLSAFAMLDRKGSFAALTSAYSRMANTGRSFGYTLVMATQRLPNIAKWSIANLQVKVILAHALKNDLDSCEEETGGLVDREDIKHLAQGTGIVVGLSREPLVVAFDKQRAPHVSNTPTVERIQDVMRFRYAAGNAPAEHENQGDGERGNQGKWLPEPSEYGKSEGNLSTSQNGISTISTPMGNPKITESAKIEVLQAVIAIQSQGLPLTRTALRDYLKWSGRKFSDVLKPICDEMHIAE